MSKKELTTEQALDKYIGLVSMDEKALRERKEITKIEMQNKINNLIRTITITSFLLGGVAGAIAADSSSWGIWVALGLVVVQALLSSSLGKSLIRTIRLHALIESLFLSVMTTRALKPFMGDKNEQSNTSTKQES